MGFVARLGVVRRGLARSGKGGISRKNKNTKGVSIMENITVKITGISPMLMHSNQGVNPLHPLRIEVSKITKKRKKTEEEILTMLDLEYQLNMYYDDQIGPYVPAANVEACLRDAAKKHKKGKDFTSALFVEPDMIPLQYEGPHKIDELVKDMRFRDVRPASIDRKSVLRCRPRFNSWRIEFNITYDSTVLDLQDIVNALDIGGRLIGLNDYRPRYGRFAAEIV
jgi:hypothetical protein